MLIHYLCSNPDCKQTAKMEVDDKYKGKDAKECPIPDGWAWEEDYRFATGHTVSKLVCPTCKKKD